MSARHLGLAALAAGAIAACRTSYDSLEQHAPAQPPPGVTADKLCWKDGKVTVSHNKSIAAKLLGVAGIAGNADDAQAAFADAVELWKAKIAAHPTLKDVLKLTYGGATTRYAGDAIGQPKREDNGRDDEFAFQVKYDIGAMHKHSPDGHNTAATGHKHEDAMPARDGDGWIWKDESAIGSTIDIDARLAETRLHKDADKKLTEGDITWFTHWSTSDTKVKLIAWNYEKDAAPAPNLNYRPVMVHEIGHLLGLDHCTAADDCEVMIATIAPGDDPQIKDGEMAALAYLYGPGGPCGPAQPPPGDGAPPDGPPPEDAPADADAPDAPDAPADADVPDAPADADVPDAPADAPDAPGPDAPGPDAPPGDDAAIPGLDAVPAPPP